MSKKFYFEHFMERLEKLDLKGQNMVQGGQFNHGEFMDYKAAWAKETDEIIEVITNIPVLYRILRNRVGFLATCTINQHSTDRKERIEGLEAIASLAAIYEDTIRNIGPCPLKPIMGKTLEEMENEFKKFFEYGLNTCIQRHYEDEQELVEG
jgi:hypothetical protein